MLYNSKLKGSFGRYYPVGIIIVYILCMIEIFIRWQVSKHGNLNLAPLFSFFIAGLFFIAMGFVQLNRYKLWVYPVLGFFLGMGCFWAILIVPGPPNILGVFYFANLFIIALIVVIKWPILNSQERFEAYARRLFKLAAEIVSETSNGYTERPFAAGKISISKDDILGFARFMNGRYIARSIFQDNTLYLIFSMNKSVVKVNNPSEVSYFKISEKGDVSVKISEKDYRQYRDTFNFNQLNEKLANVFSRFLDYYKNGNENRIITELKTIR